MKEVLKKKQLRFLLLHWHFSLILHVFVHWNTFQPTALSHSFTDLASPFWVVHDHAGESVHELLKLKTECFSLFYPYFLSTYYSHSFGLLFRYPSSKTNIAINNELFLEQTKCLRIEYERCPSLRLMDEIHPGIFCHIHLRPPILRHQASTQGSLSSLSSPENIWNKLSYFNNPNWGCLLKVHLISNHILRSAKVSTVCRNMPRWYKPSWFLTLLVPNISPPNGILKLIFLFPRWDMLVPWRVDAHGISATSMLLQPHRPCHHSSWLALVIMTSMIEHG